MNEFPTVERFIRSRSGGRFLLHLGLCATLSVAVSCGFYYFSVNWFKEHKSREKIIALQLVDAFVTDYSAIRSQFGPGSPVPATFRAHAIEAFNKHNGDNSDFRLASVGRPDEKSRRRQRTPRWREPSRPSPRRQIQNRYRSCSMSTAS